MDIIRIENLSDLDEMFISDDYCEEEIANPDLGKDRIIITGPLARIRDSKLLIANGVYCNFNKDTNELEPDFGITLLYKASSEPDLDKPLYWEQDPADVMIHNYLNIIGCETLEQIEDREDVA